MIDTTDATVTAVRDRNGEVWRRDRVGVWRLNRGGRPVVCRGRLSAVERDFGPLHVPPTAVIPQQRRPID